MKVIEERPGQKLIFHPPLLGRMGARDDIDLEHDFPVSITLDADVRASEVPHEMEIIGLKAFAEPFVDQGHGNGELRYQIDAHSFWTELRYEIAVNIEYDG